jgi:hypothetical protein
MAKEPRSGFTEVWRWLTRGKYTRALEEEVERLREDNRALVNSLLGTGGVSPLRTGDAAMARRPGIRGGKKFAAASAGTAEPARRRSWPQIGRMLEIEEARMMAQKRGGAGVVAAQAAFAESGEAESSAGANGNSGGPTRR